jgi:hypothetical protein
MYRRYETNGTVGGGAMSSSAKTVLSIISTAAIRPYIYDWTFGTIGTPSDSVMTITVTRATSMTAGTSCTSVTPNPLDPGDPASTETSGSAWTTEPTIGVTLFSVGLNVRATYRWVAAPGGELVAPATANAGLALRALSPAYVLDASGTIYSAE